MRAVCEACGAAQPLDWKAGDLCSECGAAVRRDVRCFWCAKWTPFARFCRTCAAELVEETLYGAARMLKEAGTDRFTIPKLLRELDCEQVENFTRIYQRHAAAAVRHADEARFLERFLVQKAWSAALEDDLVAQLPWDDRTLAAMIGSPAPEGTDLQKASAIGSSSPLPLVRSLAALARLRLDDWTAVDGASSRLDDGDPLLVAEAALALTGWRVRTGAGVPARSREALDALRRIPAATGTLLGTAVSVRIALLTADPSAVAPDAVDHADREIAFTAALVRGEADRLRTALSGDLLEAAAAGCRLVELGEVAAIAGPLRDGPPELQRRLVAALVARREPALPLAEELASLVETAADASLREQAARVLCRRLRPDLALRVARAARGSRTVFQLLLLPAAALPAETVGELVGWLVETRLFRSDQFGLEGAAERGAVPDGLVPSLFGGADDEMRRELLGLAEVQLRARGDEALHRFVLGVVFGPHPAKTRSAAWWTLRRWYLRDDPRGEGPFQLTAPSVTRFFGEPGLFVPRLAELLRDPGSLADHALGDFLASLLSSATAEDALFLAEADGSPELALALAGALPLGLSSNLFEGVVDLLGLLGGDPRWRGQALAALEAANRPGNFRWERAVRRVREAASEVSDGTRPLLPDGAAR